MTRDGLRDLREQLRGDPPPGLARLDSRDLEHLVGAIRAARARQAAALHEAGEQAFGYVPRLLRGPIRRILR